MRPNIVRWGSLGIVGTGLVFGGCVPRSHHAGGGGGGTTSDMGSCNQDFGDTHAAAKLEEFFAATIAWQDAANGIQRDLTNACQVTGHALGMSDADMNAGGDDLEHMCATVDARLRSEIAALRDAGHADLQVDSRPPHCEVSVDAYASCMASCEATVDPGQVDIQCDGGELRGQCDAQCTGHCAVQVDAACSGTCEGSCEGTCAARNADGSCNGQCDGTCHGSCVADAQASCQGECRGSCSVQFREPYCTGTIRRPSASARCTGSCNAHVEATARCTPGETHVSMSTGLDADGQARLARVQAAIHDGVSQILTIRTRVQRLQTAGAQIIATAQDVPASAAAEGLHAIACATAAAGALAEASASVSVSVNVSVSMSASVSGSASAQ